MCHSSCFNILSSQTLKSFHHIWEGITHQPPQTAFSSGSPELVMCSEVCFTWGEKSSLLTEGKHFLQCCFVFTEKWQINNGSGRGRTGHTGGWFEENSVTVNEEADLYWRCWLTERLKDTQTTVPSPWVLAKSTMKQTITVFTAQQVNKLHSFYCAADKHELAQC